MGYASLWVAPILTIIFIGLIIIARVYHFAEEFMALGVIGLITYIIFVIWAWTTAPSGPK